MKAVLHADGRIEFDGTKEEIATVLDLAVAYRGMKTIAPKVAAKVAKEAVATATSVVSFPRAILNILGANPKRTFMPAEVANEMRISDAKGRNYVSHSLLRLSKKKDAPIIRQASGAYHIA